MKKDNDIRSVVTINENAKPNILTLKKTFHVVYHKKKEDYFASGINIQSESFEQLFEEFRKLNLGIIYNVTEKK